TGTPSGSGDIGSSLTINNLANGSHSIQVRAVDAVGNMSAPLSYTWVVDTVGPTATITSKPPLFSNNPTPTFSFTGSDPGTGASGLNHLEYSIDNGDFITAVSPVTLPALPEGPHTFQVRGVDNLGNIGTPASYSWTTVYIAPQIASVTPPSGP